MPSANGLAFPCRKICPRFYKRGYGSCLQLKAGNCRLGHKTEWAAYFVSHLTRWCWLILKQEAMKSGNLLHGFMASCFIYFQTEPPPTKRKDGTEIFRIEKERWVKTWTNQPHPVMLVNGTFPEEDGRATGSAKQEFADARWMEISSVLKRESANGTKPVKQIEFAGERLDMSSVRQWRERVLPAK
jgi:hypothetical protein